MGRFYSGDINGKFWFGVQSSASADRFGVVGEATHLYYNFNRSDLPKAEAEVNKIIQSIGEDNIAKLDKFFNAIDGYNDRILEEHGMLDIWNEHGKDYADLYLGQQIVTQLEEYNECWFEAEL